MGLEKNLDSTYSVSRIKCMGAGIEEAQRSDLEENKINLV